MLLNEEGVAGISIDVRGSEHMPSDNEVNRSMAGKLSATVLLASFTRRSEKFLGGWPALAPMICTQAVCANGLIRARFKGPRSPLHSARGAPRLARPEGTECGSTRVEPMRGAFQETPGPDELPNATR